MSNLELVYDLHSNPASYDFPAFLAHAEKIRKEAGQDGIRVHFMPGMDRKFQWEYFPANEHERDGLFWRVCVASCRLLPSVRAVFVHDRRIRVPNAYPFGWEPDEPIQEHGSIHLRFNPLRCLRASQQARSWAEHSFRGRYMTVTVREADYCEERNSKMQHWRRAAHMLQEKHIPVIFVPDTYGNEVEGFRNCREASWDIDIRLAIYERASLNMGVGNGPMTLCAISESRFMIFTDRFGIIEFPNGRFTSENEETSVIYDRAEEYLRKAA